MPHPTSSSIRNIGQLAQLAGVSKATVSRALSDSPLVNAKTKARIVALAEASNFTIHQGARNLSLQRSQTIAVAIPINPQIGRLITDPFMIELLGAVANNLVDYNYDLLIAQLQENNRSAIDRYLTSRRADGLILFACDLLSQEMLRLTQQQLPFIIWGAPPLQRTYCSVGSDDVLGGYLATQHLLELGRRQVALIGGPIGEPESMMRYEGYKQAHAALGLKVNPDWVMHGEYTSESGYELARQLLQKYPQIDAIFANSDLIGLGAMEAARALQRQIPHDLAVVGYDGLPLTAHCSPPLTTIRQNLAEAGRLLVENLFQFMEDGVVTNHVLPVELVVRQSTVW